MIEKRHRTFTRRSSAVDELEESRKRHDNFRTSMFSSNLAATDAPELAPRGGFSGSSHILAYGADGRGESGSRIDAAIRAAIAKDAERGAQGFNRIDLTTSISAGSSAFNQNGGIDHGGPSNSERNGTYIQSQSRAQPQPHQMLAPLAAPSVLPSVGTERLSREHDREREVYKKRYVSGSDGSGSGSGGGATAQAGVQGCRVHPSDEPASGGSGSTMRVDTAANTNVFVYSRDERLDNGGLAAVAGGTSGGINGTNAGGDVNGSGGSSSGVEQGTGAARGHRPRTQWERAGGEGTPRAVTRQVAMGRGGGFVARHGGSTDVEGGGEKLGPFRDSKSHSPSSERAEKRDDNRDGVQQPPAWSHDVPTVDVDCQHERVGGHGGVALTPTGDDEPLELPDGCQHISLLRFLEVMTGPGLRVRKHHRAGKGNSGLRVLRYSQDEDSLVWDSHKILGAAQHVLPLSDVENIAMQPGNRVVLTCVGGKDSYAVFEAANDDAAAVLFVDELYLLCLKR